MSFAAPKRLEAEARRWVADFPHHRWFLDHYRLPPSDPRYLAMTDEEIAFDFYSVVAVKERAPFTDDGEAPKARRPALRSVAEARIRPEPLKPGGSRTMRVESDPDEFRTWYEANVGAWPGD